MKLEIHLGPHLCTLSFKKNLKKLGEMVETGEGRTPRPKGDFTKYTTDIVGAGISLE